VAAYIRMLAYSCLQILYASPECSTSLTSKKTPVQTADNIISITQKEQTRLKSTLVMIQKYPHQNLYPFDVQIQLHPIHYVKTERGPYKWIQK